MKKLAVLLVLVLFSPTSLSALSVDKTKLFKQIKPKKNSSKKNYPKQKGTILVTPDFFKSVLPIGHAAIVYNKNYVYEATNKGVVRGYNNWLITKKKVFGLRVKSLSSKKHNRAAEYAKKQTKKKYNFNYLNTKTRKKFYCSQLVFAAFYDLYKVNLDTKLFGQAGKKNGAIHPLELVKSSKTKRIFYYEK